MFILELTLLCYFAYVSLYSFVFSGAGLFYKSLALPEARRMRRVAVLIPAYKEDGVICDVAKQALKQNYPSDLFDVVIIADSLKPETLRRLADLPIRLVEVSFEKSTKVKALNAAMDRIGDDYDCALVLDADNVMEPDFIRKMNKLFDAGFRAVQARRDPKNENTSMAILDGMSETINNFIYRQGNVVLRLSSSLSGSGMMFDYHHYKDIMRQMDSIGGFDRELELRLLERNIKTHFANDIIVYDEKVPNHQVFETQRKRWISSHFFYLKKYFWKGWQYLFRGNIAYFNSAVLRNIQLPRLLNLGSLGLVTLLSIIFFGAVEIHPLVWVLLLGLNIAAIMFALPAKFYTKKVFKSLLLVPGLFVKMFLLLFKLKNANKTFIHTPHGVHVNVQKKPAN